MAAAEDEVVIRYRLEGTAEAERSVKGVNNAVEETGKKIRNMPGGKGKEAGFGETLGNVAGGMGFGAFAGRAGLYGAGLAASGLGNVAGDLFGAGREMAGEYGRVISNLFGTAGMNFRAQARQSAYDSTMSAFEWAPGATDSDINNYYDAMLGVQGIRAKGRENVSASLSAHQSQDLPIVKQLVDGLGNLNATLADLKNYLQRRP